MRHFIRPTLILSLSLLFVFSLSLFAEESEHESHHPSSSSVEASQPAESASESGGMMGGSGMMRGGMMGMMHGQGQGMQGMMGSQGQGMMGSQGMMCPMCAMMGDKGMVAPPQLMMQAEALELTDQQQAELRSIAMSFRKQMITHRADRELAEVELDELLTQDDVSLDTIEAKLDAISDAEVAMKLAHIKTSRKAKGVLTPQQAEKWEELKRKHRQASPPTPGENQ